MKLYFDLPLSQKLASLGITSESGKFHFSYMEKDWEILDGEDVIDSTDPTDDVVFAGAVPVTVNMIKDYDDCYAKVPAYQMSDVFHKEALRKIFKDGLHKDEFGIQVSNIRDWQYHRDRMIEIYSEGDIEKLEEYLMENL